MAICKCKMCGGDLNITELDKVVECEYCGTTQTVPSADSEKKMTLFNRANRLRLNNEFDKSAGIYESIIAEFPEEAEAYWGIVLCKYGIEYVDDPATGKKIPTCHRSSFDSVLEDDSFEQACDNADAVSRRLYREEAKKIEDIRKGIIEVSSKEEPYDIFICYKETDENGDRTVDSVIAQDVYNALTEKGYRVFFSRISLEDKLGQEYEPYIFSALNSAKIMLVFGTDFEYFNAVWVKNEWSRFLMMIEAGQKKTLIPCYKDLDAYDMPKEFAKLQAQDMGKVGAMQDLLAGIDKIMNKGAKAKVSETPQNNNSATVDSLLKRAFMFLEDGNWASADEYAEKVLDIDPENGEAYLAKLMVEYNVKYKWGLSRLEKPIKRSNNYKKAYRYGGDSLKKTLDEISEKIQSQIEENRKYNIYSEATQIMKEADSSYDFDKALNKFQTISEYEDSKKQIEICKRKKEEFAKKEEAERQEHERKEEAERQERERKEKERQIAREKRKKIAAVVISIIASCVVLVIVLTTVIVPGIKYHSALKLYNAKKYDEAYIAFNSINNFKDSAGKAAECLILNQNPGLTDLCVGSTIKFGFYEQDNNTSDGKEEIEWKVLEKKENKVLVISKLALDHQPYNDSKYDTTWEKCTLRTWLNETFYNVAFDTDHQQLIACSAVTTDNVFILSETEAIKYFSSDEARKCAPTDYAKAQGVVDTSSSYSTGGKATCYWWLRQPDDYYDYISYVVDNDGSIQRDFAVCAYGVAVRPAMWISLG